MPNKGVVSFSDPLLSDKLLNFENYPEESEHRDTDITIKIAQNIYHYMDRAPVYYQSDHSPTSLNAFIHRESKKFRLLMAEFEQCIEYLDDWVLEETIMIQFGENDTLVPADYIFDYFLERLKGDDFSDHRTLLYSDGKKNLEIIAVLVREASISLEFRRKEIITMLSDEGLTLCSGGCLARLSDAAENLKNYGKLTPFSLIKTFIVGLAKETALRKEDFSKHTYSGRICSLANILITEYEVHAMNYLLERLKSDLGLHFLKLPNDPHIETIKLYLKEHHSKLDTIYVNYRHAFQRQLNASNLINFISYQLYEESLLQSGEGYYALRKFIEGKLEGLGNDSEFSWGEIFSEDGYLKSIVDFRITVAERLLDSQWLDLRCTYSGPRFRFYSNNIVLGWIKFEGIRRAVVDVIAKEDFNINSDIFFNTENLKFLLQGQNDIYLFFKELPLSQHTKVLENMVSINLDVSTILDKRDESIDLQGFYNLIKVLSEEALGVIAHYYPKLVHSVLCQLLAKADGMDDSRGAGQITHLITLIINAGFRDFTNIVFKKSKLDASPGASYMKNINFSGMEFCNTVFEEPIFGCNFSHANLIAANFQTIDLNAIDFEGANLSNCNFKDLQLKKINFRKANLKNASFQCASLVGVDFEDADLTNCNFESSTVQKTNFIKANLDGVSFKYADLYEIDFKKSAGKINFSLCELNKANFSSAKLVGSTFEGAQLSPVDFEGANLANCNFDESSLENISFIGTNLQYASFKKACLVKLDFFNSVDLSYADFNKAILTKVNFSIAGLLIASLKAANMSHIDCFEKSLSSLMPALFLSKLNKVNFQDAKLFDCKFEDFCLEEVKFIKATLENVSFIYSNLTQADFSESILKNINFTLAELQNASFKASDLGIVNFNETTLKTINFSFAKLEEVNFQDTDVDAVFTKANLTRLNFERSNLEKCNLNESTLENISFRGTNLRYVSFKAARLNKLNFFNSVDLSYANFSEAKLNKVNFSLTEFFKVNLKAAKLDPIELSKTPLTESLLLGLHAVNFQAAKLFDCKFEDFCLEKVKFIKATLENVSFIYSDLYQIDFSESTLKNINLSLAKLKKVGFKSADLINVDFSESTLEKINVSSANLQNVNTFKTLKEEISFPISQLHFFYTPNNAFNNSNLISEWNNKSNQKSH